MHGIPFSMYVISWIAGKNLPECILWGHTLVSSIGFCQSLGAPIG